MGGGRMAAPGRADYNLRGEVISGVRLRTRSGRGEHYRVDLVAHYFAGDRIENRRAAVHAPGDARALDQRHVGTQVLYLHQDLLVANQREDPLQAAIPSTAGSRIQTCNDSEIFDILAIS